MVIWHICQTVCTWSKLVTEQTGTFDCVENVLWAALSGTGLPNATEATDGSGVFVSNFSCSKGSLCNFTESDVHELMKLSIYFALENTTYRLNQAQINQAEIDFSIDGIAQITWSGNATTIDQVDRSYLKTLRTQ